MRRVGTAAGVNLGPESSCILSRGRRGDHRPDVGLEAGGRRPGQRKIARCGRGDKGPPDATDGPEADAAAQQNRRQGQAVANTCAHQGEGEGRLDHAEAAWGEPEASDRRPHRQTVSPSHELDNEDQGCCFTVHLPMAGVACV